MKCFRISSEYSRGKPFKPGRKGSSVFYTWPLPVRIGRHSAILYSYAIGLPTRRIYHLYQICTLPFRSEVLCDLPRCSVASQDLCKRNAKVEKDFCSSVLGDRSRNPKKSPSPPPSSTTGLRRIADTVLR
jgi:hypothetical protein